MTFDLCLKFCCCCLCTDSQVSSPSVQSNTRLLHKATPRIFMWSNQPSERLSRRHSGTFPWTLMDDVSLHDLGRHPAPLWKWPPRLGAKKEHFTLRLASLRTCPRTSEHTLVFVGVKVRHEKQWNDVRGRFWSLVLRSSPPLPPRLLFLFHYKHFVFLWVFFVCRDLFFEIRPRGSFQWQLIFSSVDKVNHLTPLTF